MTSDNSSKTEDSCADKPADAVVASSFDFETLIGIAPAMVAVHEGPEHHYVYSNPAHDHSVGHRQLIGRPLRDAMHELEGQNVFERFDRVFQTGEPDEQTAFKATLELPANGKTTRFYRQTLKPWRGVNGAICGVMSFAYDVTDEVEAKEAAAQQKANLEFALDVGGGVGTWDWNIPADTIAVDQRFAALFGIDADDTSGLPLARFIESILPEDRGPVESAIAAAVVTGKDYRQEYRVTDLKGDLRWITARGRCNYDAHGNPQHFPGVVVDVTQQVEAQAELERAHASLGSILDNSASYIFAKDLEGRYLLANRFYLKAFGESEETLYGKTDRERFGDDEIYSLNDRRVAETGQPIEFEEQAVAADGRTIHAISIKFPLRNANGKIFGTGSISTDISARKEAEAALELSEDRRQRAMAAGSVGTFEYHAQEERVVWDTMSYTLFGFDTKDTITLETIAEFVHPADRAGWQQEVAKALDPGGDGRHRAEFRVTRKINGEMRWIEARGETSFAEGLPLLMLGTVRDITERKEYEERLRLLNNELKHRVKNLFAVTGGMIRVAGRQEPEMAAFANRLSARINSLAAAHTVGMDTRSEEPLDLGKMLKAVLRPFLHDDEQRIRIEGPSVVIPTRIVTPLALIVYELATNAFKHGSLARPLGTLQIEWQQHQSIDPQSPATLEIRWLEDCGEPITISTDGEEQGFGSQLIAGSAFQMDAAYDRSATHTGIKVTLKLPLEIAGGKS